jgi:hypothetical protein
LPNFLDGDGSRPGPPAGPAGARVMLGQQGKGFLKVQDTPRLA